MKTLFILPVLFLTLNLYAQIDESEYLEKCETEFQKLLDKVNKTDKEIWENKLSKINKEYVRISKEKQLEEKIYRDLKAEDVYAYQYLNAVNNFLLPSKTQLTNQLAAKVVYQTIERKVGIKLNFLERIFDEYANTDNAEKLENTYFKFLNHKDLYEKLKIRKDTLFFTVYDVKNNVYADPDSSTMYVIYNWERQLLQFQHLYWKLNEIETEIQSKKYILVKDPNPVFPVLFQICTLLIIIANSFVNFQFNQGQFKILFWVVILSLITSVLLLMMSQETILNSAINIFVPGVTYIIYYLYQKKKQSKTIKNNESGNE